jgi:phosphatidyl-myo-inositol alpha-mannosyltransferase
MQIITAVSETASSGLIAKASNNPKVKAIRYIPNGIDLKSYKTRSPAPRHPNMKTILYIGRLEGRKGVNYLLRAFSVLAASRDDVQLYVAGSGPDEAALRSFVKENDIPRVTFLGFISNEDKISYLHRADLFCAPAHKGESFGIVLLEAMAASCPIVAGDNKGYLSVMKSTGALSLVNPKDTIDFSRRLEIMIFNEDIRNVWLKWAQPYVQQFDYPKIVTQYEDAYKEAVRLHDKRPKAKSRFSLR